MKSWDLDFDKFRGGEIMEKRVELFRKIAKAVVDNDKEKALLYADEALTAGIDPVDIIEQGLVRGMREVGDLFEKGDYALPLMFLAADVMKSVSEKLKAKIPKKNLPKPLGRFLIATVEGDVHDLGRDLVALFLEAAGFEVYNAGHDVPNETIIEKAEEFKADIVGLSTLISPGMFKQAEFVELLNARGLSGKYKVMIGGCVVTEDYATMLGVNFGKDAAEAVKVAKEILGK
jgi:trimethylamine corrinoid protein